MDNVFERIPGYSNQEMVDKCQMVLKILDTKVEKTIGRGKAVTTVLVKKYKTHKDAYDRAVNSLAYYKKLLKEENGI
jgi:hypothetical protein